MDTFGPVTKMVTVRTFLYVATTCNWEVHQMKVHSTFLHGDLHEKVYMRLRPGFQATNPHQVCHLNKYLYGLHQAPHCQFAKLIAFLSKYGFTQSYADYSPFTYTRNGVFLCILIYVDDLLISGNNAAFIAKFKAYLSSCFHMKDLSFLKLFLGIEIA